MITLQDQAHRLWWAARDKLSDEDLKSIAEMNHIGLLRAWQLGYALEAIAGEVADDGTLTHQRAVVALLISIRHALDGAVTMIELGQDARLMMKDREAGTLSQLRFASFAVIILRRDLHPQECAHAGRTSKRPVPKNWPKCLILWWASGESNPAPTDYESAALTRHELEARDGWRQFSLSRKLRRRSERVG